MTHLCLCPPIHQLQPPTADTRLCFTSMAAPSVPSARETIAVTPNASTLSFQNVLHRAHDIPTCAAHRRRCQGRPVDRPCLRCSRRDVHHAVAPGASRERAVASGQHPVQLRRPLACSSTSENGMPKEPMQSVALRRSELTRRFAVRVKFASSLRALHAQFRRRIVACVAASSLLSVERDGIPEL
jgi:hypothetical protein